MKFYTQKTNEEFKKFLYNIRFVIYAIFIYPLGSWFINALFPVKSTPVDFGVYIFKGFIIPYLLIYAIVVMIALAWLIHGFGFIVIKR